MEKLFDMTNLAQIADAMKPLMALLSVLPPIEVKQVKRDIKDEDGHIINTKEYVVIYIEKPQKAKP